jgi:hypothetical protein
MSDTNVGTPGPAIGGLSEVRARFSSTEAMHAAIEKLEASGFDRADLSLPELHPPRERSTPESGAKPADTEEDARQTRTMHVSTAAAIAGLAAAGAVIGTGGAVGPAVAAAVLGGGAVGGATFAISSAVNSGEQRAREQAAAAGTLVLSVRAPDEAKRTAAQSILRAAGAAEVQ